MKHVLKKYKDPFMDMVEDFSSFFEDLGTSSLFEYPYYRTTSNVGKVNVKNDEKEYIIDVSFPGFTKEELNVDLNDGILTVNGEHKVENSEEKKNYSRKEFSKKSFSRSFNIPNTLSEELEAKLENGILSLTIKKKELPPKPEPKRIEIKWFIDEK